jgi:hypothetical protein
VAANAVSPTIPAASVTSVNRCQRICWDIDVPAVAGPSSGERLGVTTSVPSRGSTWRNSNQNCAVSLSTG